MFVKFTTEGFSIVVPLDNISLVIEKKDRAKATIFFRDKVYVGDKVDFISIDLDETVEEAYQLMRDARYV